MNDVNHHRGVVKQWMVEGRYERIRELGEHRKAVEEARDLAWSDWRSRVGDSDGTWYPKHLDRGSVYRPYRKAGFLRQWARDPDRPLLAVVVLEDGAYQAESFGSDRNIADAQAVEICMANLPEHLRKKVLHL